LTWRVAWGIVWVIENPRAAFNEQKGETQYSNFAYRPPSTTPHTAHLVVDEYRVITRAKLGNHPKRNFANLTGDNEEGPVVVFDDLNGNWTWAGWRG
jgi:hypothetical protein